MINNCIVRPAVFKFKSEYELVQGSSPISDETIVPVVDSIPMIKHYKWSITRDLSLSSAANNSKTI